jgi:hypothetical protein
MPELNIVDALNRLAAHFFPERPPGSAEGDSAFARRSANLVNAVAIGAPPESEADLTIFVDPAAAECEDKAIHHTAKGLVGPFKVHILRCGPFEGLAAGLGASIAPLDVYRDNIPPVSAGTFGATVANGNKWYVLGSNHVLANNGQTPLGTNVREPGALEAIGGGARIGAYSGCVPLITQLNAPNQADCAWAELASPPSPLPGPQQVVTPVPATAGMSVAKIGRTTHRTVSKIRFPQWIGLIDFNFGTFLFSGQFGTWDAAGADPPFAAPGDSGSLVTVETAPTSGVGLACARGYAYDAGEFRAYVIISCPLDQVISGMKKNGLAAPTIYAV